MIKEIRGRNKLGSKSPSLRAVLYGPLYDPKPVCKPVVRLEAESVVELIPRKDYKFEPLFTADLTRSQLADIVEQKLILPDVEGFTQNIECLIRRATEASSIYWDKDRRDLHMMAQQSISLQLPSFSSKQDYLPYMKKSKSF